VTVNGQAVTVESASYNSITRSVTLALTHESFRPSDVVAVHWNNILDAQGATVTGQATVSAR